MLYTHTHTHTYKLQFYLKIYTFHLLPFLPPFFVCLFVSFLFLLSVGSILHILLMDKFWYFPFVKKIFSQI
jgi:hypothetical protein